MGRIGKILQAIVRNVRNGAKVNDLKTSLGAGRIVTAGVFQPAGEDSSPLSSDWPILVPLPGSGRYAVVGYVDTTNAGTAAEGEKRFYARDASGAPVGYIWLKADGSIELNSGDNHAVQFEALQIAFDQLKTDLDTLVGVFNGHTHSYLPGPGAATPTATTATPGATSTADITPAQIDSIKVP